jgi:hypothetical protein
MATVAGAPAGAAPPTSPAEFQQQQRDAAGPPGGEFREVPGLGPARRAKGNLLEVRMKDGSIVTTHGNDVMPDSDGAKGRARLRANFTSYPTGEQTPVCAPAGTPRVYMIYVRAQGQPDRYATLAPQMRTIIRRMDGWISTTAVGTSGGSVHAHLRVACAGGTQYVASTTSVYSFTGNNPTATWANVRSEMYNKGYNDPNIKYLILFDGGDCWHPTGSALCYGGISDLYLDSSRSYYNSNNYGNTQMGLAWGSTPFINNTVAMHELLHTMGAVQNDAPDSTGAGHCVDDLDVMCYNDGGPNGWMYPVNNCTFPSIDCWENTYFDAVPPVGGYLDTHWNIGWNQNRYLAFS